MHDRRSAGTQLGADAERERERSFQDQRDRGSHPQVSFIRQRAQPVPLQWFRKLIQQPGADCFPFGIDDERRPWPLGQVGDGSDAHVAAARCEAAGLELPDLPILSVSKISSALIRRKSRLTLVDDVRADLPHLLDLGRAVQVEEPA